MVGERGPELMSLPAGAAVTPLTAGAGSGDGVPLLNEVNISIGYDRFAKVLAKTYAKQSAQH